MRRILLLVVLSAILAVSGFAQADLQPAAIVNLIRSEPITVKQFRTEVERVEQGTGRTLNQAERLQVLDMIINERLAVQAAERDKVSVTDNDVNQQLQQMRNSMAQVLGRPATEAEFNQAVREESGLDIQAFREQVRRQLTTQKYLMQKKENLINSIKVPTRDEITQQFNLVRSQFVRPETVRFSMIQVAYGPDAASRTRAMNQANTLLREIGSSSAKFDEVSARGQAANSTFQAGDGGYLPRNQEAQSIVGKEFIDIAFSLKLGEVSRLIEGVPGTGYQIIKITESYTMKTLELDDILQLGTNITVQDYIGNVILQERQQTILVQASQELVTELRAGRTFQIFERNLTW